MGLFGGSALKRKIAALTQELETTLAKAEEFETKCTKLQHALGNKDESFRVAKEGRQKAEKKLEKLAARSMSNDKKLTDMGSELNRVKAELKEYRDEVLSARAESDALKARLAKHTESPMAIAPEPAAAAVNAPAPAPAPGATDERKVDRRIARLEEQLESERQKTDEIKARALRAEQKIRDAGRKRASDAGKLDARLREVEHALQSERKAYKILQLQYEALLEASRGLQHEAEVLVPANVEDAVESSDETADAIAQPNTTQTDTKVAEESAEQDTKEVSETATDESAQEIATKAVDADTEESTTTDAGAPETLEADGDSKAAVANAESE